MRRCTANRAEPNEKNASLRQSLPFSSYRRTGLAASPSPNHGLLFIEARPCGSGCCFGGSLVPTFALWGLLAASQPASWCRDLVSVSASQTEEDSIHPQQTLQRIRDCSQSAATCILGPNSHQLEPRSREGQRRITLPIRCATVFLLCQQPAVYRTSYRPLRDSIAHIAAELSRTGATDARPRAVARGPHRPGRICRCQHGERSPGAQGGRTESGPLE